MNNSKRLTIILILVVIICWGVSLSAQNSHDATETCLDPHVRTILLYRSGWDLSMPVIYQDEDEALSLEFDYLDTIPSSYNYAVVNCTYDWKMNDISEHEYVSGFNDISINELDPSVATTSPYTHFSTVFPNDEIKISKSGNYLVRVYKNGEPDNIIFTKRFCIAERLAGIQVTVKRPDTENQEINLEVDLGNLNLQNPINEVKIAIIKNFDWNNKPNIALSAVLRDNKLEFDLPFQIMATGGNEFRFFDIKSTKFISERVDRIEFINPDYHIYLKLDETRQFKPYLTSKDMNGRFFIDANDVHNKSVESDYVFVHFTLHVPQPFGSDVYIYGALTDYKLDESNFMIYNSDQSAYEKTLLLKQGYYNYAYATKDLNKPTVEFDLTEGIHSETENDYAVLVYLKRTMSDFDRLIGFKLINSNINAH